MRDGVPFPSPPSEGITAAAAASAISAAPAAGPADAGERMGAAGSAPAMGPPGTAGSPTASRWAWEPPLAAVLLVLVGWRTEVAG